MKTKNLENIGKPVYRPVNQKKISKDFLIVRTLIKCLRDHKGYPNCDLKDACSNNELCELLHTYALQFINDPDR